MEQEEKLTSAQIRAARGLCGVTQAGLAKAANVSTMTVKRAEGSGNPFPAQSAIDKIKFALEELGVLFIPENGEGVGVRLQKRQ